MRFLSRIVILLAWLAASLLAIAPAPAVAASPQHESGILALTAVTAKAMPMLGCLMGFSLRNNDTADIYVGFDSTVTNTNYGGIIKANGGLLYGSVTYQSAQTGTTLYFYSVGGTATGLSYLGAC